MIPQVPPAGTSASSWRLTRLFQDQEIGARIFMQALALRPEVYMPKDRYDQLIGMIIRLSQKLEKAKYHADRCTEVAQEAIAAATADSVTTTIRADMCSGVEAEAEAFFFQAKATLDLLCKLLGPTVGIKHPPATFGDYGAKVVLALRRNVRKELAPRAETVASLIEEDQGWLRAMIDCRDGVAHFKGLESTGVVSQRVGESVAVSAPAGRHGDLSTQVQTLYFNLLTFCEDFVALAINVAMPSALTVRIVATSGRSDLSVNKYAIGMVAPPTS